MDGYSATSRLGERSSLPPENPRGNTVNDWLFQGHDQAPMPSGDTECILSVTFGTGSIGLNPERSGNLRQLICVGNDQKRHAFSETSHSIRFVDICFPSKNGDRSRTPTLSK
jgi:hypothetical protein